MHAKPLDHVVGHWGRTLIPCVWWCVVPAGFASGQGYLMTGDPTWSGKSPTGTTLAFYWSFLFAFFVSLLCLPEDYVLIIKKFNGEVLHSLPKALNNN